MGKIGNFEKKYFSKIVNTPVPEPRPDFRGRGTPRNFQYLVFFCGASGARRSTIENLSPIFWFSKKLFSFYIEEP